MVFDPLRDFPGYALRRASNASMSELTPKLAKLGLRVTEATVLIAILHNPRITQSEIGRMLGIASANIAPMIGRLDGRDLLKRIRVDGRSHGLELTEKGNELTEKAFAVVKKHEEKALAHIPPGMKDAFIEALGKMWAEDD